MPVGTEPPMSGTIRDPPSSRGFFLRGGRAYAARRWMRSGLPASRLSLDAGKPLLIQRRAAYARPPRRKNPRDDGGSRMVPDIGGSVPTGIVLAWHCHVKRVWWRDRRPRRLAA